MDVKTVKVAGISWGSSALLKTAPDEYGAGTAQWQEPFLIIKSNFTCGFTAVIEVLSDAFLGTSPFPLLG